MNPITKEIVLELSTIMKAVFVLCAIPEDWDPQQALESAGALRVVGELNDRGSCTICCDPEVAVITVYLDGEKRFELRTMVGCGEGTLRNYTGAQPVSTAMFPTTVLFRMVLQELVAQL